MGVPVVDRGAAYIYYRWELAPEIDVSPASLDFGAKNVDSGPTSSKTVTISNIGDADLHTTGISLIGTDAAEFAIDIASGEHTLAPGETLTVQVTFDPSSTGSKSANLRIASDDADEPTVDVTLSGSGTVEPDPPPGGEDMWYVYLPLVGNND